MSQRTVTDLIPGEIYYFKVRGKAGDNFGPWSATLVELASVGDAVVPTPDAPSVQGQILHLVATWNDLGPLINTYEVHIKPTTDADYVAYVDPDNPGWAPRYGAPSPAQNTFYGATASTFASIDRYFNQVTMAWEPLKDHVTYAIKIIAVARETLTPGGPANKSDPSPEGFGQIKVVSAGDGSPPPDPTQGPVVEGHIGYFTIDMKDYGTVPSDFLGFEVFFATLADGDAAWSSWTTLGNQGTLVLHGPLDYSLQYKYRYRVTDVEEMASGYSDETVAGKPPVIGENDFSVPGSISAEIFISEIVLGKRLITTGTPGKNRVEIQGDSSAGAGIYLRTGDGTTDTGTTISMPVEGTSKFEGTIDASGGLTVSGKTAFTSSDMVMSAGSQLLLTSHVPDPSNAPTLQKTWEQIATPQLLGSSRGVNFDSSTGHFYMGDGVGNAIWEIDGAGNKIRSKKIIPFFYPDISQSQNIWGAARNGTNIWALCQGVNDSKLTLRKFDISDFSLLPSGSGAGNFGVGITNFLQGNMIGGFSFDIPNNRFLIVEKNNANQHIVHKFSLSNLNSLDGASPPATGYSKTATNLDAQALGLPANQTVYDIENAEGFWWIMVSSPTADLVYQVQPSDGQVTDAMKDRSFPYQGSSVRGISNDGTQFWTMGSNKMFKHTTWDNYSAATNPSVFVRYSWMVDDAESAVTTISNSTRTPRRQQLIVSVPDFPSGVTGVRVYAYVGNGDGSYGSYELQSDNDLVQNSIPNISPDQFFTMNIYNTADNVHTPQTVSGIPPPNPLIPSSIHSATWEINSDDAFRAAVKGPSVAPNQGTPYSIGPLTDDTDGGITYNPADLAFYGMSNGIYTFLQPIMSFDFGLGDLVNRNNSDNAMFRATSLSFGANVAARGWGVTMPWSGSVIGLSYNSNGTFPVGAGCIFKVNLNGTLISGVTLTAVGQKSSTRFAPNAHAFAAGDDLQGILRIGDKSTLGSTDCELLIWVIRNG